MKEVCLLRWVSVDENGNNMLNAMERKANGEPMVVPGESSIVWVTYYDETSAGEVPPRFFYPAESPFPVGPKRTFYAWAGKVVAT